MKYTTLLVSIIGSFAATAAGRAEIAHPNPIVAPGITLTAGVNHESRASAASRTYQAVAAFPLTRSASVQAMVVDSGRLRDSLDGALVITLLAGLVAVQLRRSQDRLQRPFGEA